MPHVGDHEGQKPERQRGGEAVPDDIAQAAIAGSEIDRQQDRDRQRRRDAGESRHHQAE